MLDSYLVCLLCELPGISISHSSFLLADRLLCFQYLFLKISFVTSFCGLD